MRSPAQQRAAEHLKLGRLPGPRTPAQTVNLANARARLREAQATRRQETGPCPHCTGVNGHPVKHGSSGYLHGCKCNKCMEWMRGNGRRKRKNRPEHYRAYQRKRYAEDPERGKAYKNAYDERHPDRQPAANKRYYQQHRREIAERNADPGRQRDKQRSNSASKLRRGQIPNPNDGRPWTVPEDEIVMQNQSLVAICYRLGRSYNAVTKRRWRLRTRA